MGGSNRCRGPDQGGHWRGCGSGGAEIYLPVHPRRLNCHNLMRANGTWRIGRLQQVMVKCLLSSYSLQIFVVQ